MTHKQLPPKVRSYIQAASIDQLRLMLITILALLGPNLTKKQRRSLAITENELTIRKAVQREKTELRQEGRSKTHRRGNFSPARKAALRKAIHANKRMGPEAKRKALEKLR